MCEGMRARQRRATEAGAPPALFWRAVLARAPVFLPPRGAAGCVECVSRAGAPALGRAPVPRRPPGAFSLSARLSVSRAQRGGRGRGGARRRSGDGKTNDEKRRAGWGGLAALRRTVLLICEARSKSRMRTRTYISVRSSLAPQLDPLSPKRTQHPPLPPPAAPTHAVERSRRRLGTAAARVSGPHSIGFPRAVGSALGASAGLFLRPGSRGPVIFCAQI